MICISAIFLEFEQLVLKTSRWGGMAAISGWLVELDSRTSLQYDYSVAFLIMAVCWGLDLLVVAGLNVPETRGVSTNPWAEVT